MANGARDRSGARRRAVRCLTLASGWTLLAAGAVLLVLPGPGFPLLLLGLAVLGREASWARRLRHRVLARLRRGRDQVPLATPAPVPARDARE